MYVRRRAPLLLVDLSVSAGEVAGHVGPEGEEGTYRMMYMEARARLVAAPARGHFDVSRRLQCR